MPTELDYEADGGTGYRAPGVRERGAVFAFGHGLGYARTTAEVTGVAVVGGRARLELRVANHGDRDGVHVAQVYAEVGGSAPELAAVVRIPVVAAGGATAEVVVGPEAFARWGAAARRRVPVAGAHRLWVGTASDELGAPLAVTVVDGKVGTAVAAQRS